MAKDAIFRQKFWHQWIRSFQKPRFKHYLGYFVLGHFWPKKAKNGLKGPKMAKDAIFRHKFWRQWIRSVEKPQFHYNMEYLVSGHFLPKKAKNGLKRQKMAKNTVFDQIFFGSSFLHGFRTFKKKIKKSIFFCGCAVHERVK